jgi:hypothetical protein
MFHGQFMVSEILNIFQKELSLMKRVLPIAYWQLVKLRMYGKVDIRTQIDEGHRVSITRHDDLVQKNRHILNRIVDCLKRTKIRFFRACIFPIATYACETWTLNKAAEKHINTNATDEFLKYHGLRKKTQIHSTGITYF